MHGFFIKHGICIRKDDVGRCYILYTSVQGGCFPFALRLEKHGYFRILLQEFIRTVVRPVCNPNDFQFIGRIGEGMTVLHLGSNDIFFIVCRNEEGNFRKRLGQSYAYGFFEEFFYFY